jgi:hypothetical protein
MNTFAPPQLSILRVVLEAGPQDGGTRDIEDRDCRALAFGVHRRGATVISTYKRTVDIDAASGRVVFRFARYQVLRDPTRIERFLVWAGLRNPQRLTIE